MNFTDLPSDLQEEVRKKMEPEDFDSEASDLDTMLDFLSYDPDYIEELIQREFFTDFVYWILEHRK